MIQIRQSVNLIFAEVETIIVGRSTLAHHIESLEKF